MPKLIKNIEAELVEEKEAQLKNSFSVNALIGNNLYFNVYGYIGYIQDFSSINKTNEMTSLTNKGIKENNKSDFTEIDISY